MTPIGKSDHMSLELELKENVIKAKNKQHRKGRLTYNKADLNGFKHF